MLLLLLASVAMLMEASTSPPEEDDFRSVFQSAAEADRLRPRPLLSDAQLLDKLEKELEALDDKRLTILKTMKSLQEAPYSTRHSRALEQARYDAARTSRRIHRLFQQHQQMREQLREEENERQAASTSAFYTLPLFPLDEERWQLLYQQYAAVTDMLNSNCLASLKLQQQLHTQSKQPNPATRPSHRRPLSSAPTTDPINLSDDEKETDMGLPVLQLSAETSKQQAGKREEFMRLQSMVADVAAMFQDVRDMVTQHTPLLSATRSKLALTRDSSQSATRQLQSAQRYSSTAQVVGLTAAGGAVGALIGGPVGALLGAKTAVVVAAGGVGLLLGGVGGGIAGSVIAQKARRDRVEEEKRTAEEGYVAHRMFSGRETANRSLTDSASDLWCSIWSQLPASSTPAGSLPSPARRPVHPVAMPVVDGSINRPDPTPGSSSARVPPPAVYSSLVSPSSLSSIGVSNTGKQRTAIWSRRE